MVRNLGLVDWWTIVGFVNLDYRGLAGYPLFGFLESQRDACIGVVLVADFTCAAVTCPVLSWLRAFG